ncbi:hypothetical protein [Methylobacterium sp. WL120]|uniref:hypothetical protein n=1 Tax=Methylobacterium sp. WL120 TaxID=2603887 RepID=UPI0011CA02D3|nr:hypothetical protein [Methylobacterium sp. WL120]TXM60964.1 hypothetical protein FV229_23650 [Methylobacterium sp. WL120]
MIDAGFTFGGDLLGFVALGLWIWLACTSPSIQAWIMARYEDELQMGTASPMPDQSMQAAWLPQLAYRVAMAAIVCQSIGFAIPD